MAEDILNQLGGLPNEEPAEEVKVPDKKKSSGKPLDDEVIASMMANGDNTRGMFEPNESEIKDKDEKIHEDPDEEVKLKTKGDAKPSKKYETEFQKDMIKNPENYYINTPKGKMTIKEAMQAGYNPITKMFNNSSKKKREDILNQLNDKDKAAIEKLMDPSQLGLAPADAESLGIKPNSPMIKNSTPSPVPAQAATLMSEPAQPAGQQPAPDINTLLGGNV